LGTAAIEVSGLSKSYGAIKALDGTSLSVESGRIFGLVGPNGSGKSTLINALCGILKPDAGEVRVLGTDARRDRYALRRRLGYMPQSPALYEDLSPRENLRFFGGARDPEDIEARIRETLELVQLWDRRDDPVHTFSGGMRQRSSLACALLHDPELLILDEPTAGIDPNLKQSFWHHFQRLCGRERTIFLSTNQMDEALHCDRVAVIIRGRILICDTPRAIQDRGQARVVITLADGSEKSVEVGSYQDELPQLLAEYGLARQVNRISVDRQSFEEVILSLIEKAG
jgi:ABC-2 type transport system ATP-binding protein